MDYLTPEQLAELATRWERTARCLNDYQAGHWADFSLEQHLDLNAYQSSLLHRAQDLATGLLRPSLNGPAAALAQIELLLTNAQRVLGQAAAPQDVMHLGAVSVALAAAVARSNDRAIQNALRELAALLATA